MSGDDWIMFAGQSSFVAVLSVLSDELFWFCLQNEIGRKDKNARGA